MSHLSSDTKQNQPARRIATVQVQLISRNLLTFTFTPSLGQPSIYVYVYIYIDIMIIYIPIDKRIMFWSQDDWTDPTSSPKLRHYASTYSQILPIIVVFKKLRSISETLLGTDLVKPGGLFCLDILRMEAGLPRVGADLPVGLYTPIRAALAWTLDQSKMRNLGRSTNGVGGGWVVKHKAPSKPPLMVS